ncbi:glycosyl hydrolase family 65 protein [Nonomuraea sp. NPDC046570]|uniref:glycoside hydrolase family 65 protein n=1 Tax=Nonomuraea sp. NPDC046570 TaxID=3155255 RepID=UPI0034064DE7
MNPWKLTYLGFDPASEGVRETLCTLGNGYFATRGATADGDLRSPGTYVAGCYDRLHSTVAGREVTNEEMVNLPDWLPLTFATPGSDRFRPEEARLLHYRQELDMRHGLLHRSLRYQDEHGRVTSVRQRRLVSMADPHLAALETTFTAENWSGPLQVNSTLEGRITNVGVARYRDLRGDHLTDHTTGQQDGLTWLSVRTRTSGITITLAARTEPGPASEISAQQDRITERHVIALRRHRPATFTKIIAVATCRDHAPSPAQRLARQAPAFPELLERHRQAWNRLWERARLDVDGPEVSQIVRLHVFHLLQTLSPHAADLDVGVPARGLHGEAYRGHVFWDELFVLPWLDLRFPEISRALLRYRWRRLPEARAAARAAGHAGAMFPWQSGSDGREETPAFHLNPASGHWLPDHSHLQRHVGLAIARNVWRHHLSVGDTAFMTEFGAELLVEIARFFASLAVLDPLSGRYEIRGVMGPDEYHDAYPGAAAPGLDNNAYTNIMTVWLLTRTLEVAAAEVTSAERTRWQDIGRRMRVDFHDGVISQFTGYGDLRELDWERYKGVRRLDRALEADGDHANHYRVSKQADVLMLFYLLPSEELLEILSRLGYPADPGLIPRTIDYYLRRTSHGSTLSAVVHAWVLAGTDRATSWQYFTEALISDVEDVQGGTTAEGIHLGAMAGSLDLLQRCYLGLDIRPDGLQLDPLLPDRLSTVALPIRVREATLMIEADSHGVLVSRDESGPELLRLHVYGQAVHLGRGESRTFTREQRTSR